MIITDTARLIIRNFRPDDWLDLYEYLSQDEVLKYEPEMPNNEAQCRQKAKERSWGNDFLAVCLKTSGKMIGHLYFSQTEPQEFLTWELGYIFNPAYYGQGYATEACRRIIQYVFEELHAHRIIALCSPENTASWRLLERLSMRREGHFKKPAYFRTAADGRPLWHDAYQYAVLEEEWKKNNTNMDNKEKFTNKAADYVKYRPSYPQAFVEYLGQEVGLTKESILADVGAGTGILTKQLADKVKQIYAVEPNLQMRKACETYCASCENLTIVGGSAEDTRLSEHSVDFISVAQAFHWFDREKTKHEFRRILKPGGRVVLVWNSRVPEDDLTKENDRLFQRICPDFNEFSGGAGIGPEHYREFFRDGRCDYKVFHNDQFVTLDGFIGRSLSASYAPLEGDANYREFIEGLTLLFNKYNKDGLLSMPYITHSYVGEV